MHLSDGTKIREASMGWSLQGGSWSTSGWVCCAMEHGFLQVTSEMQVVRASTGRRGERYNILQDRIRNPDGW